MNKEDEMNSWFSLLFELILLCNLLAAVISLSVQSMQNMQTFLVYKASHKSSCPKISWMLYKTNVQKPTERERLSNQTKIDRAGYKEI